MFFRKTTPTLLAILFLCDLFGRTVGADYFSHRAWEAVTRYSFGFGPFQPNKRYSQTGTYGDLAVLGNFPRYRISHLETFTTDGCGFRNDPELLSGKQIDVITAGSSFTVGSGVNDRDTLAMQLKRVTGLTVYNAGGAADTSGLGLVLQRLKMRRGTIVLEYLESRQAEPVVVPLESANPINDDLYPCNTSQWFSRSSTLQIIFRGFYNVSPVQIAAQRALRTLNNDVLLPNAQKAVVVEQLKNGRNILFWTPDVGGFHNPENANRSIEAWKRLSEELTSHDLKLVLMLVPSKYSVYFPLLKTPGIPPLRDELAEIESSARTAGIITVNLKPLLQTAAEEGLRDDRYVYSLDDTHWNAEGIAVAAQAVAEQLRQ
jgi:hypothetical protein